VGRRVSDAHRPRAGITPYQGRIETVKQPSVAQFAREKIPEPGEHPVPRYVFLLATVTRHEFTGPLAAYPARGRATSTVAGSGH
jgi:hypothetical protein